MEIVSKTENLIDSAIGAIKASTTEVIDMDIDDHVHQMVLGTGYQLLIDNKAKLVNNLDVRDRPPVVTTDGTVVGGY